MAGLWGKLPLHGDFLALGLDDAARACVVPWLDTALSALREAWGEDWGPRFDAMGGVGFWIGPAVAGGAPVAGVMAPSRDKVGRRYPLVILGRGEVAPPMLAPTDFHARAGAVLTALLADGRAEPGDWPQDLAEAEAAPAPAPEDPSLVWARNAGLSGADLLAEILRYDHVAACAGRVQVWTLSAPGVVLTCDGMPSARGLGWLIEASQGEGAAEVPAPDGAMPVPAVAPQGEADLNQSDASARQPDTLAVDAPAEPDATLRLEPRFRVGAEEQSDSRLVLRTEWALPEAGAPPAPPVDAAIWHLSEPPAAPAPDKPREGE